MYEQVAATRTRTRCWWTQLLEPKVNTDASDAIAKIECHVTDYPATIKLNLTRAFSVLHFSAIFLP